MCAAFVVAASLLGFADVANAHNSLTSSEPADGAVLDGAPTTWSLTFTGVVPLESASAELVFADGTRAALPAPAHGTSTSVIVFALPENVSGDVTGRWRLVGTDGHVITGRVQFGITAAATIPDSIPATSTPGEAVPADSVATSEPVVEDLDPLGSDEVIVETSTMPSFVDPTSEQVRWVLQILFYTGLIIVGGLVFADLVLARGILRRPRVTLALQAGALLLFVVPAVKGLVHVADLEGVKLTSAFRYMGSLFDTTAGSMLFTRSLIGFVLLMVTLTLDQRPLDSRFVRAMAGLVMLHIVTVPFVGHSRSMRWPAVGVPTGIVHLAGVTIWVGGLLALVAFVMPAAQTGSAVIAYVRFSKYATWSVIAIVATGVIQTARLYGVPVSALESSHGVILAIKVVLVGVMLGVGWWARRLLTRDDGTSDEVLRSRLIRITALEATLGVVIVAVSAALVRATFST